MPNIIIGMELKLTKGFNMFNLMHNTYSEVKRSGFLIFVVILAFCGAILSTWFYGRGFNGNLWFMFALGACLGIGKFSFGISAIFAQSPLETKIRKFAVVAFLLLSIISLIAGIMIFDQNIKERKAIVNSACEEADKIKKSIEDQFSILEGLISQHKIEMRSNYFTRADSTYSKIREENEKINVLRRSQMDINRNDLVFLPILDVLDYMIPIGLDLWQKIITVIFGSLLEILNMFLLYLIWEVSKQSVPFMGNVVTIGAFYKRQDLENNVN